MLHDLAKLRTPAELVEELGVPHRARAAFWRLLALGEAALPAMREAMHHPNAEVRRLACLYVDHYLAEDMLRDLIAMLDDPDPGVRRNALHALACDRCKEGTCRPDEAAVLPKAIALMQSDSDAHVRAFAVGLVGQAVHHSPAAVDALLAVIRTDPSPAVRKKARCCAPGGAIYKRTFPKAQRTRRSAA